VATLGKDRTLMKQLRGYCDSRGYVLMDQLSIADMDRFYASWKDGKRTRAKKLERLKAFVKFCLKRKWLAENICEDLRAPEGSSIPANKTPFTDEEIERIYAACDALGGPTCPGPGHRKWSGEDVKDFIMLSVYTGLRISDVATFNILERLKGNDVFLRMHKTRKELYTWIPDWLVARLREREKKLGPLIFRYGESTVMRSMAELWRVKLAKVFRLAGPFDEPATSHRFRHTFVRILLEKGVPVADVAELIGDTEQVVRKHYAKWVPGRQARLSKILKEAFEDKPRPRVVVMPRRK
jgi:integrase